MPLNQRGFTLLETLIAMAVSSVVLSGTVRLLPALQMSIVREYQHSALQEAIWQLAFSLGKNLQRAGYCHGTCAGKGLRLSKAGSCVLVRWDANSNGRWESAPGSQSEQTGYRLRDGQLETLRGAAHCEGSGWEKLSDPEMLVINKFSVQEQKRAQAQPLLIINIEAALKNGNRSVTLRHLVPGNNL